MNDRVIIESTSGAEFSPHRTYRYALWRTWDASKGAALFIGLNPSTADENTDDPTIRRCIGFAKAWDYGSMHMVNLFAFRATQPAVLKKAGKPVGRDNDEALLHWTATMDVCVAAWGAHQFAAYRAVEVTRMLARNHVTLHCLGRTKEGFPRHPLYLKADTELELFKKGE